MAKWSLFKKSKTEDETNSIEETKEVTVIEEETVQEDKPLAEYKETLYSGTKSSKTYGSGSSNEQRYWRNVDSIEKKVDHLHITRAEKPSTEVDKTVDKLIEKRKKK